jgi:hypothetical protein
MSRGAPTWFETVWSYGVEAIDFLVDFVVGNSNKLQKLGLEGKINWALNVVTLGPMARGTLVEMKKKKKYLVKVG